MLYLCFPFFAWAVAVRLKNTAFNLLLIAATFGLWVYHLCPTCTGTYATHYLGEPSWSILRGVLGFILGIGLYNLFSLGFLRRLAWDWIALAAIAMLLLVLWLKSRSVPFHDTVFILLFIVLIYALAQVKGFMARLFSSRPLLHLGNISYSFYMLHWIYAVLMLLKIFPYFQVHSFFTGGFALSTAILIALSTASYYLVERPARAWLRGRIRPA
jgi:peptidoglycan/LPS O-acetylase OafA/YrhL